MRPRDAPWLVLAAGLSAAQEPSAPPSFPAAVEQVVVDAVVLDERGSAVTGLSRDDFLLTEDGTPQALVTFEAIEALPPVPGEAVPRASASSVATNVAPVGQTPPRTFAFVFDDLGLTGPQGARARAAVAEFVRTQSLDQILLVTTSGRERWAARTAEERADLLAVLDRLRGLVVPDISAERMTDAEAYRIHVERDGRTATQVADRYRAASVLIGEAQLLAQIVEANAAVTYQRAASRVRSNLAALEQAAAALDGAPGRKSVVLVSPGFYYEASAPEYRRVREACRRANAAVYFLNAAGLEAMPVGLTAQFGLPFRLPEAGGGKPLSESEADQAAIMGGHYAQDRDSAAGADVVANDTGGFVVRGTDDLAGGLARIVEDSRAYYLLSYVSTNAARDGKYRRIAVRLAPKADPHRREWDVRARRGYHAPDATGPLREAGDADRELRRALDSPVRRGEIPLRLAAYAFEDSKKTPGTVRCLLLAEVDLRAVSFREERGRSIGRLDAVYEARARDTSRAESLRKRADLKLLPLTRETLGREWYRLERELELRPGVHQATVAVRDAGSGRLGSVGVRLDVPEARSFRTSTPIVSDAFENDDEGWPHPRRTGRREFAPGASVYVALDVYGAALDPRSKRENVTMGYEVLSPDGEPLLQVKPSPIVPTGKGRLHRFVGFELEDAGPGEYRVVGRIVDGVASRQLTFAEPFTVASPPEEPPVAAAGPPDATHAALLEKAGRYVVEYERVFHDIVADEEYRQRAPTAGPTDPGWRRTRADIVFARLAPPIPWGSFRDVYEVNGREVRDRDARLEKLFRESPGSALTRAEAILAESARYNIGPERTVNLPTLPLLFLHPQNQARFSFELKRGEEDGGESMEVAFREVVRPTIVRDRRLRRGRERGRDLPAEGRFWIDPRRGTVVRSEVVFRFKPGDSKATIATEYRVEPSLTVWVPAEMRERYEGAEFGGVTEAVARYSGFRQFQVTVGEGAVRLPPP